MEITFYKNNSEPNRIDKDLTTLFTLSGTLKDETSIVDPVVLIESTKPINANYAYIPEFARVYFIKDIVCVANNLWRVSMHCDVLSSFKNEIRSCNVIVSRQQYEYNMYLPDNKYPIAQNTFTITTKIGPSFDTNNRNVLLLSSCGSASN